MSTNPDVLRLAREVAASLRPYSHNSALILDGERDGIDIVQIAIAAIERTTELVASWLKSTGPMDEQLHLRAMYLLNYDHLRQPEKGSTDE